MQGKSSNFLAERICIDCRLGNLKQVLLRKFYSEVCEQSSGTVIFIRAYFISLQNLYSNFKTCTVKDNILLPTFEKHVDESWMSSRFTNVDFNLHNLECLIPVLQIRIWINLPVRDPNYSNYSDPDSEEQKNWKLWL